MNVRILNRTQAWLLHEDEESSSDLSRGIYFMRHLHRDEVSESIDGPHEREHRLVDEKIRTRASSIKLSELGF